MSADPPIEDLARQLWGEPNRDLSSRTNLRFGANGSKSVKIKERVWHDHETETGGGYVAIYKLVHGQPPPVEHINGSIGSTTYEYRNAAGTLLFEVIRTVPKTFRQRRRGGAGGWLWNLQGVERVLYRLPELLAADRAEPVFVVEGEKDVDNLRALGLVATTNPGGASKWLAAYSEHLRGRDVVVLPDNDEAGRKHANDVQRKLRDIAASVRILDLPGLPPKGDATDWLAAGGSADALRELAAACKPWDGPEQAASDALECVALSPIGPANIPPRPWAYGHFLLFGSAAVLGAVDGGGKGAIAVALALAMITGRPLLGERVWRTGPVAIVTYEDDEVEWHRRFAAACLHYELDYAAVIPHIHFIRHPSRKVCFATFKDGTTVFPDGHDVIAHLRAIHAVLLIVDPFNHAHNLDDGNSNVAIAKVAGELSGVAHASNVAVLVLHHLRKGANGNPDDLMGATSLRATFRSCRILARMTPEVAEKMNIAEPWRYIRLAGSKENYAPPPERSTWFKLTSVSLNNATAAYSDGDSVGVVITWQPRPAFEGMDGTALAAVFAELRANVYGPSKRAKHTPWAGKPLIDVGGRSESEAAKILAAWIENGVLTREKYYHAPSKNHVERVTLDDARAAAIIGDLKGVDEPVD